MFSLDEQFLVDVGLADLPPEQKEPFLQHIYSELELRVGTRLSEGLSDAQIEEFESIIDHNSSVITNWLERFVPNYRQDPLFERIHQGLSGASENEIVGEYTATKWLELNRPDYRDIVASTLAELKQEITQNKDALLG